MADTIKQNAEQQGADSQTCTDGAVPHGAGAASSLEPSPGVQHPGEDDSNDVRRRAAVVEPLALRTYTPSLAVLARSEGSYHWTPEGRKLADFTSGVLVANLGHNPTRWWRRLLGYLGLDALPAAGDFFSASTLTAYNALTPLEVQASERLVASLRGQPGGSRLEQVMWAASGSEAVQKAIWAALDRRPAADIILATRYGFHGKKGLAGAVTGSEDDAHRDPRVRFISFPMEECRSVRRDDGRSIWPDMKVNWRAWPRSTGRDCAAW